MNHSEEIAKEKGPLWSGPLALWTMAGAFVGVAVLLAIASLLAMYCAWLPAAALAAVLVVVWCAQRPSRWLYLLIGTIFLESSNVSLFIGGARIRPAQIILLPALANTFLFAAGGLTRLRRIPLVTPLFFYLVCNFLSTLFSVSPRQSVKISLLLATVVALYAVAYTLMRDDLEAYPSIFRFFIVVGLFQIGYGLYQVVAGYANARFGVSLPVGALGIVHTDYLGTTFGRPYGSLPEPDTYGAVCLFYALLFGLMWFTPSSRPFSGRLIVFAAASAAAGLLVGMVRASWIGFCVGLAWAFLQRVSGRLKPVRAIRLAGAGGLVLLAITISLATSPNLREIVARRFDTRGLEAAEQSLTLQNARLRQMAVSFQLFRQRPLIGNGPGSFSLLGDPGAHQDYYIEVGADLSRIYDPSIITTILNDTGLLGMAAFLVLVAAYFVYTRRCLRRMNEPSSRNTALSAHCAFVGLFASFVFTQYFWMPFTWLFLSMVVMLHEMGLQNPDWWRRRVAAGHSGCRRTG